MTNQTKSQFLAFLAYQVPNEKKQMHCLAIKRLFKRKKSIDKLKDELQLLVLENKRFDSVEKSETSAISVYFGLLNFRRKKRFLKYYYWKRLYNHRTAD